jgi:hypothetical protein
MEERGCDVVSRNARANTDPDLFSPWRGAGAEEPQGRHGRTSKDHGSGLSALEISGDVLASTLAFVRLWVPRTVAEVNRQAGRTRSGALVAAARRVGAG